MLTPVQKLGSTINTRWGTYYTTAFCGVRGKQIEKSNFSEEVYFAYGKAMGCLPALSKAFEPKVKKQTYEDILNGKEHQMQGNGTLLEKLALLHQELALLPRDPKHFGLVY